MIIFKDVSVLFIEDYSIFSLEPEETRTKFQTKYRWIIERDKLQGHSRYFKTVLGAAADGRGADGRPAKRYQDATFLKIPFSKMGHF